MNVFGPYGPQSFIYLDCHIHIRKLMKPKIVIVYYIYKQSILCRRIRDSKNTGCLYI